MPGLLLGEPLDEALLGLPLDEALLGELLDERIGPPHSAEV